MSHQEIPSGLDSATRQQEKDLVIDLAPDRILHHIGVNLLIILAVITKVTEVTGSKLTCFPINDAGSTLQFIKYTNSFCWQSPAMVALNTSSNECQFPENQTLVQQDQLMENAFYTKRMIQWLPYAMLLEAFLFALPMAYWHFTLGAVLMGHLKFMGLLLESIYETLKVIPSGIYRKKAYDRKSKCFDCWREWKGVKKGNNRESSQHNSNEKRKMANTESNNSASSENHKVDDESSSSKSSVSTTKVTYQNESQHKSTSTENCAQTGSENVSIVANEDAAAAPNEKNKEHDVTENTCLLTSDNTEQRANQVQETHSEESPPTNENTESIDANTLSHSSPVSISETCDSFDDTIQAVINPDFTTRWKSILDRSPTENTTDHKTPRGTGTMQDRHIFSMLCYENFASMHHQPYLKSVEKLSRVKSFEEKMFRGVPSASQNQSRESQNGKSEEKILPLKHAILRRFCDEENFNARVVVQRYQIKSAFTIGLGAFVWMLILTTFVFTVHPTLRSDSFLCHIPYHEKYCSVCTISGLIDVHAAFFSNWIAVTLHLIISSVNLWYFTRARNRAIAHFLDDIKPLCCVALAAAYEYEKANPIKKDDKPKSTPVTETENQCSCND